MGFSLSNFFKGSVGQLEKIRIQFAIKADVSSQATYQEIVNVYTQKMKSLDTIHIFEMVPIVPNLSFNSREEALKYAEEHQINLIIWGNTYLKFENGEQINEITVHYAQNHLLKYHSPNELAISDKVFNVHVEKAIFGDIWSVTHPELLPHFSTTADHVEIVGIYMLVRTCMSFGFGKRAFTLAQDLLDRVNRLDSSRSTTASNIKSFTKGIAIDIAHLLSLHFLTIKNDIQKADYYAEKTLQIDPNNYTSLINYSTLCWTKGDKDRAIQLIEKAIETNPTSNIALFNKAFFFLGTGKYPQALATYTQIHRLPTEVNLNFLIEFLKTDYKKSHETALLFGIGYLLFRFGNKEVGLETLREFIKKSRDKIDYKPLYDSANAMAMGQLL